jgi:predicted O-methyltransferase YrrM
MKTSKIIKNKSQHKSKHKKTQKKSKKSMKNKHQKDKHIKKFQISNADYNNYIKELNKIMQGFKGTSYEIVNNWFNMINISHYKNRPINYLEIGTFYGANILSVAISYGLHKNSKLYCVDPWEDYDNYPEYKDKQNVIYNSFLNNIENSGVKDKIIINRGYSNIKVPMFQDEFFDIIYIDGNHEPSYVLEDAVLCFRKLKKGGIMIFDDYGWGDTQVGIDGFLSGYHKKIEMIGQRKMQIFLKKTGSLNL